MTMNDEMIDEAPLEVDYPTHEVTSDGRTVWVTGQFGDCIARFGHLGIDIHRPAQAQLAGEPECLECTHGAVNIGHWERFKVAVLEYYQIVVGDEHRPNYLQIP